MTDEPKVETNIPIPPRTKWPLHKLTKVGQSIFFKNRSNMNVASSIAYFRSKKGNESKKFRTKKMDGGVRIWRIA